MKSKRALYIGLMSGTSMNAVDAVLVSFDQYTPMILETHSCDIPVSLKKIVTQLSESSVCDIRTFGETDTQLGMLFAETCIKLLKKTVFHANEIIAIGSHGQTIYHQPNHTHPFTLQIGDPNIIAAQTGITTVADFRRRDVALGGQ
ncbi:MAG: anhydro-N-acetylmuramic acid kinase, partial [uncultured bacterium]